MTKQNKTLLDSLSVTYFFSIRNYRLKNISPDHWTSEYLLPVIDLHQEYPCDMENQEETFQPGEHENS